MDNVLDKKTHDLLWANRPGANGKAKELMEALDVENENITKKYNKRRNTHWVTRELVIDAFKELRSKGFMARANYLCCQSCAGYALAEDAKKRIANGKTVNGVYFWHRQDEEDYEEFGHLFIAYGDVEVEGKTYGLSTEQVGLALVTALVKRGVHVQWNGNTNRRILVIA